jgi:hypothetical protein
MILGVVATLALGGIATQTMWTAAVTIEPQALAATMSPFDMMRNARGLPVAAYSNAI